MAFVKNMNVVCLVVISVLGLAGVILAGRHYRTGVHLSERGCGVIPKIKVRHRSRDAGLASFGQIPWQVGIFQKPEKAFLCSGALISSNVVVTSPICLLRVRDYSELEIRLGDWDISDMDLLEESFDHFSTSIYEAIFYPDLGLDIHSSPTVSLLRLQDSVDFNMYPHISPVCIPSIEALKERHMAQCFISGWGFQNRTQSGLSPNFSHWSTQDNFVPNVDNSVDVQIDAANSFEEIANSLLKNNSTNTLERSRISGARNLGTNLPDPVEDYLDELLMEKSHTEAIEDTELHNHDQITDNSGLKMDDEYPESEYKSPNFDTIYPIPEHHESSLYKHKLKYKKGKMIGSRPITKVKKNTEIFDDNDPPYAISHHNNHHRYHRAKRTSGKHRRNRKVLYSSHADPAKATYLKLFQVEIHGKCDGHTRHCVSPTNGHFASFPCMVDLGSPIYCTFRSPPTLSHSEEHVQEKYGELKMQQSSRSFITGFVSSWSPQCIDDSHNAYHLRTNFATIFQFSPEVLQFIYDNLV